MCSFMSTPCKRMESRHESEDASPARRNPKARKSSSIGTIRKQCLERIKRDREAKRQSFRGGASPAAASEESCRGRARAILDDVLSSFPTKRRRSDTSDGVSERSGATEGGVSPTVPRTSFFSEASPEAFPEEDADALSLSADEELTLVRELEDEIRAYELEQAETFAHDLAMEALSVEAAGLAFDQDEALRAEESVLCPVCSDGYLIQDARHDITCAKCDLYLPDQLDGLDLGDLRARLADTFAGHAASGCERRPTFAVDRRTGISILTCACASCAYRQVVI